MIRQALADRIVVYSDTIVAFALVNGFAFIITLADPDIRCSIAAVAWVTALANAIMPVLATASLFWLRGYEARLRSSGDGEDAGEELDPLVRRFEQRIFTVRLVLIWVFAGIVILGIYAATRDPSCRLPAGVAG